MKKWVLSLICGALCAVNAQDRTKTGKQLPSSRPIQVQQVDDSQERTSPLPKIELPEFVITGNEAIHPPDIEKGESDEGGVYRRGPEENGPGSRERETLDLGNRFRQTMFEGDPRLNGNVTASVGSFSSTRLHGAFGQWTGFYDYLFKARYSRTKGYVNNSDASGGGIGASGSLVIRNETPIFDGVRIGGGLDVSMDKYRFYGSVRPETVRDLSGVVGVVEASSGVESPLSYQAGLQYRTLSIKDSAAETTENQVRFSAAVQVPLRDIPLRARFEARLGTVTALSARNISLIEIALESSRYFLDHFFASASIHGYTAKGMEGQSIGRLYPQVSLGYQIAAHHTAVMSYQPRVEYSSLREQVDLNPYLSTLAVLRHPDAGTDLSGTLESQWIEPLATKMTLRYQSIGDYPLYADSSGKGMWTLAYAGRTKVLSFEIEAVANLTPNDYFAGALVFTDARNSMIAGRVPSIPSVQGSALYRLTLPAGIVVSPRMGYVNARRLHVEGNQKVAGYFFTGLTLEYQGLPRWTLFGDVKNLFDKRYEVWRGYRAEPFSVTLGVSARW